MLIWLHTLGLDQRMINRGILAIELKPNASQPLRDSTLHWLKMQSEVVEASVQLLNEADLKDILPQDLVTDSARKAAMQLLPSLIVFKVNPGTYNRESFIPFESKIRSQKGIENFHYQNELTQDLSKSVSRMQKVSFLLTCLFVLIGILISEYLAQVFVDSRTPTILQWNRLGAGKERILKSYLKRSLSLGLASACLSVSLLGLMLTLVNYLMPWIQDWVETIKFLMVLLLLLIIGPSLQYILVKHKIQSLIH